MSYYSGQHGQLFIGDSTKAAAAVSQWSLNASMSPLDTTSLEQTDQTFINGLRSTTGSCSLFYYDDGTQNDARDLIEKLLKERTVNSVPGVAAEAEKTTLKLRINDGTTNGQYVTLECLFTSAAMSMAVGEVLSAAIAFQVTGAPVAIEL